MYSTYDFYTSRGGKMTETEWKFAAERAAEKIDCYTFGRAETAPKCMKGKIQKCECELADILRSASQIPLGISSEGNDGVSVSYSQNAQNELDGKIYAICREYLMRPVNLMYAGSDGFD